MAENELRQLRLSQQIPAKDLVEVVRELYPKYDKTVQSKCENTEAYGTVLAANAMKLLRERFGRPVKTSRHGKHRYTRRITCRLPDAEYAALQQRMVADGYSTAQALLTELVRRYLAERSEP